MPADAAPSFVWAEEIPQSPGRLALDPGESHYLTRVCRVRAGERLTLTDGRGVRAQAVVIEPGASVLVEVERLEREIRRRTLTLLVGPPERGRADWMVEKLAELGVTSLRPIDTDRASWAVPEVRPDRWRRLARAALRQARRCHELELHEPVALAAALETPATAAARVLADPEGTRAHLLKPHPVGQTIALVGPAQGFSTSERQQVTSAGYVGICLSDGRLRTETAALALAGWWSAGG